MQAIDPAVDALEITPILHPQSSAGVPMRCACSWHTRHGRRKRSAGWDDALSRAAAHGASPSPRYSSSMVRPRARSVPDAGSASGAGTDAGALWAQAIDRSGCLDRTLMHRKIRLARRPEYVAHSCVTARGWTTNALTLAEQWWAN